MCRVRQVGQPCPHPQTDRSRHDALKRAASIASLLDRTTPWLAWWQELILNWCASWATVGELTVTSSTEDKYIAWNVPTDTEMARMELEELIQR